MITPSKPNTAPALKESDVETSAAQAADALQLRPGVDPALLEEAKSATSNEAKRAAAPKKWSEPPQVNPEVREASNEAAREIGSACLGFRLRLLDRVVARIYDDALRGFELRRTQLDLLAALQRFGPASPAQLINILGLEKSSLSRNLRRLIKRELVAELPGQDRRCHTLELTEAGHQQLTQALPAWRQAQEEVGELLGEESGEAIRRMARHYWQQKER